MAAIVIAAAGAGIGYAVGGTFTAAALGWSIGSMLAPKPTQKQYNVQPLLSDLRVTGGEYGQTIPWVKGTVGIAGQMWWNTARRARTTTTVTESGGGKGGGGGVQTTTTTTTYDMDCLIGLTDNVIIGISRIWDNGKLIYTADASATGGSLAASISSPYWTRMTVYTGASNQEPDPTYETAVTTAEACAYRGRGTVFIAGLQLGQSGQVPNLTFEVVMAGSISYTTSKDFFTITSPRTLGNSPSTQISSSGHLWYADTATDGDLYLHSLSSGLELAHWSVTTGNRRALFVSDSLGNMYSVESVKISSLPTGKIYRHNIDGSLDWVTVPGLANLASVGSNRAVIDSSGTLWFEYISGLYKVANFNFITNASDTIYSGFPTPPQNSVRLAFNATGIAGRIYISTTVSGTGRFGYLNTSTEAWTQLVAFDQAATGDSLLVGLDGNIYTGSGNNTQFDRLLKYDQDGVLLASLTLPSVASSGASNTYSINQQVMDHNGFLWVVATGITANTEWLFKINYVTMTIIGSSMLTSPNAYDLIITYDYDSNSVLTRDTGGSPTTAPIELIGPEMLTSSPPTVQTVQSDVCLRAGLTAAQFDVTGLSTITRTVRSLAWSQISSARSITELLMSAYFYEMVVSDKIYFRPRGAASQATLAYNDLGAHAGDDQPEPLALRQANDIEIPAQIALSYINVSDDYQTDTQYSDRLESAIASTVATVQMALGMTPAEAKAVADTMLLDQAVSAVGTNIALLGEYARLEPTDPVTVTDAGGNTYRMRLVKKTDSYPLLTFEAVLDDVSILTSQESTSTDYDPQTTVDPEVNTLLRLLDIPILRDEDDDAGFYVAVKGDGTPYPGSAVFNSPDNVTYTRQATVLESGVFGLCTTTLGDWTGSRVFDEVNTVTVNVGSGTLASSTMTAVLDDLSINSILIGSEVIQFLTATLVSAGVYTLSRLLRGCRGTEWASTGHAAGERAVLLRTSGLRRILLQNNELGLSRYYKGVTIGRAQSTATASTFTNTAIGRKPFSPIIFKAGRDASNNITFVWQRRTRLAVRMIGTAGISAPLGEDTESYEIDVYSNSGYTTVVRTITATSETASYTAAQQTTDGLTPGNTVYCKVYQISAQVGRGYALQQAA